VEIPDIQIKTGTTHYWDINKIVEMIILGVLGKSATDDVFWVNFGVMSSCGTQKIRF